MRDLIDHHARDMMLDLTGERRGETLRVDPTADMPAWPDVGGGVDDPVPFGPAEAADCGLVCQTHAGSGEGRKAAHGAAMGLPAHVVMAPDAADAVMLAAASHFAALLDWSVDYAAAAGPLPLASAEPYHEPDESYRARVGRAAINKLGRWLDPADVAKASGDQLDRYGYLLGEGADDPGLPRARLVPAEDGR